MEEPRIVESGPIKVEMSLEDALTFLVKDALLRRLKEAAEAHNEQTKE